MEREKEAPQFKCLVLNFVFPRMCAGNLYSREVQVDGEQVIIQVQDTPGAEVGDSSQINWDIIYFSVSWLC